tara:strand:- start:79 stop:840 length:762 start_codon:yes stop_codon:yes gene_type:complete
VNVFLPIIAYGGQVHTEFMLSMMGLMQSLLKSGMTGTLHPINSESLISRGRNAAAAFFLKSDCDYMLFVDTDMSFTARDFNQLSNLKKPLAIGAYCKKYISNRKLEKYVQLNHNKFEHDWRSYVTNFSTEIPNEVWSDVDNDPPKHIKVNYGATGFMLIHRSVFETIIKKRPDLKYKNDIDFYMGGGDNFYDFFSVRVNPDTKKYESEDYGFCQLWRECGGEIHCATDTNLGHIGRHHYTGNLYKQLSFFRDA